MSRVCIAPAARALVLAVFVTGISATLPAPPGARAVVDDNRVPETQSCPLRTYDFDLQADLATIGVPS